MWNVPVFTTMPQGPQLLHYLRGAGDDIQLPSPILSKKMATAVSTALSFPALNSPYLRRKKICSISCMARKSPRGFRSSERLGIESGAKIVEGEGNLPKVVLTHSSGSQAEIYLFGGCITSWTVPSGRDMLFVPPDAVFDKSKPISGGISHCFPQIGPGKMPQHGFARNMEWTFADSAVLDGRVNAGFQLTDGPYSRSMWDFSFEATYMVILDKTVLMTFLVFTNTDSKAFSFNAALRTYFRAFLPKASVGGLKGCKTLNRNPDPRNPIEGEEERDAVTFPGFVDCIYRDAPYELLLDNGMGDVLHVGNKYWPDAALWNPHLQMEPFYRNFVCVDHARIEPVKLKPLQFCTAWQVISVGPLPDITPFEPN